MNKAFQGLVKPEKVDGFFFKKGRGEEEEICFLTPFFLWFLIFHLVNSVDVPGDLIASW